MSALTLMLIRHAEKPGRGFPGPGLTSDGVEDDKSLVIRGWQRAGAWAALFVAAPDDYPRPNAVYAAAPMPLSKKASFSHRPFETAGPTAARLGLGVRANWYAGEERRLVAEILRLTGVVVVFWEHKAICGAIIPALLGTQEILGVPLKWDGDRFDVALRFDRELPGGSWTFRQLSPCLLSGDTDAPLTKCVA